MIIDLLIIANLSTVVFIALDDIDASDFITFK